MTKGIMQATKAKKAKKEVKIKEIEQENLVSPSSSQSTTTYSTSSESLQSEEDYKPSDLLDSFYDYSYDLSEEASEEEIPIQSFAANMDFLPDLASLPDIDDISVDVSIVSIKRKSPRDIGDIGVFVDPLTGMKIQVETKSVSSVSEPSIKSTSSEKEFDWDSIISGDLDEESSESHVCEVDNENLFENLMKLEEIEVVVEEKNFDISARELQAKEVHRQTLKFLDDLILKVIETSELRSPEIFLRENLDKHKLISQLFDMNKTYVEEKSKCRFLNRKMVEFYKRKKVYRPITKEDPKNIPNEKTKYLNILKDLDEQMAKLQNLKNSHVNTATKLLGELKIIQANAKTEELKLEAVVKKTLCRDERPQLNELVECLLNRMNRQRRDLSDMRYQMIIQQNTHGELFKKHERVQVISEGLSMKVYNHLVAENQALDKNIYERNSDMSKLRIRMQNIMHILAHYREKQSILREMVTSRSSILKELLEELKSRRKYIYELELKRNAVSQEIKKLNIAGSLIHKPALLYDYDKTMEYISEKRDMVNKLRCTYRTIKERINRLEQRLANKTFYLSSIA